MNRVIEITQSIISGKLISEFTFHHEIFGEGFYTAQISTKRASGQYDILPVMVSDRLINVHEDWMGRLIKVNGQLRSYNRHEDEKNKLLLFLFVREIEIFEDGTNLSNQDENSIMLEGFICKVPIYRETPLGREITDILLAVNRPYSKSDYIPCIAWGRNSRFASGLEVGTHIKVVGRFQSREYVKKFENGTQETRTAYEVSVSKLEVVKDEESNT